MFDPADNLSLAYEMAGKRTRPYSREARLRAAIGRAYYAAFIVSRNFLRDVEGHKIPRGGTSHQYVIDVFLNSSDPIRKQIGKELFTLRMNRNKADYDDVVPNLTAMCNKSLNMARFIINKVQTL